MLCVWKVPEHLPGLPRVCEGPLEGLAHVLDLVVVLLYVGTGAHMGRQQEGVEEAPVAHQLWIIAGPGQLHAYDDHDQSH